MTIEFPEELQWVGTLLGLGDFPKGDEDKLNRLGAAWIVTGQQLDGLTDEIASARDEVLAGIQGPPADQFVEYVRQLGTAIPPLSQGAVQLGESSQNTATEIQYAKMMYIAMLIWVAVEIAMLIDSIFGAPAVPAVEEAGRIVIKQIMKQLLKAVLRETAVQVGLSAAVQAIQKYILHTRKDWNYKALGDSAIMGAVSGATGALIHVGATKYLPKKFTAGPVGAVVTGAVIGATQAGVVTGLMAGLYGADAEQAGFGVLSGALFGGGAAAALRAKHGAPKQHIDIPKLPPGDRPPIPLPDLEHLPLDGLDPSHASTVDGHPVPAPMNLVRDVGASDGAQSTGHRAAGSTGDHDAQSGGAVAGVVQTTSGSARSTGDRSTFGQGASGQGSPNQNAPARGTGGSGTGETQPVRGNAAGGVGTGDTPPVRANAAGGPVADRPNTQSAGPGAAKDTSAPNGIRRTTDGPAGPQKTSGDATPTRTVVDAPESTVQVRQSTSDSVGAAATASAEQGVARPTAAEHPAPDRHLDPVSGQDSHQVDTTSDTHQRPDDDPDRPPSLPPDGQIWKALGKVNEQTDLYVRAIQLYPPLAHHDMLVHELPYERRGLHRVAYTLLRHGEAQARRIADIEYARPIDLPRGPKLDSDLVNDVNTRLRALAGPGVGHVGMDQVRPPYEQLATQTTNGHTYRSAADRIAQILHDGKPTRIRGAGSGIEVEATNLMTKRRSPQDEGERPGPDEASGSKLTRDDRDGADTDRRAPNEDSGNDRMAIDDLGGSDEGRRDSDHDMDQSDGEASDSEHHVDYADDDMDGSFEERAQARDDLSDARGEPLISMADGAARVIVETKKFYSSEEDSALYRTKDGVRDNAGQDIEIFSEQWSIPEFVGGIMRSHEAERGIYHDPEGVRDALFEFERKINGVAGEPGIEPNSRFTEIYGEGESGLTDLGRETLIGPRTVGDGTGFHVHYTHGSTYVGLRSLLRHVHDDMTHIANSTGDPQWRIEARTHLEQALEFGDVLAARYLDPHSLPTEARQTIDHAGNPRATELSGYAALLYSNAALVAHGPAGGDEPKKLVAVLSRNNMADIYRGLDPTLRHFLHDNADAIAYMFRHRFESSTPSFRQSSSRSDSSRFFDFPGEGTAENGHTIGDYLNEGLGRGRAHPIKQSDVVTTTTLSELDRNNSAGIPLIVLEIRAYGDHFVNAATAWNNHLILERVTQEGFEHALRLTGGNTGGGHSGGSHPGGGYPNSGHGPGGNGPGGHGPGGSHPGGGGPGRGGSNDGGDFRQGGHGGGRAGQGDSRGGFDGGGSGGHSADGNGGGRRFDGGDEDAGGHDGVRDDGHGHRDGALVLPSDDVIDAELRAHASGRDLLERAGALYPPRAYQDMLIDELPYQRRGLNRVAYTLDHYGEDAARQVAAIEHNAPIDLPLGPRLDRDLLNDVNTALPKLAGRGTRHVPLEEIEPVYRDLATHTHNGHTSRSAAERIAQILHRGRPDRMRGAGSGIEVESTELMTKRPSPLSDGGRPGPDEASGSNLTRDDRDGTDTGRRDSDDDADYSDEDSASDRMTTDDQGGSDEGRRDSDQEMDHSDDAMDQDRDDDYEDRWQRHLDRERLANERGKPLIRMAGDVAQVIVETKTFYRDEAENWYRAKDDAVASNEQYAAERSDEEMDSDGSSNADGDDMPNTWAIPEFVGGVMRSHAEETTYADPAIVRDALFDFERKLQNIADPPGSEPTRGLTEVFDGYDSGVTDVGGETLIGPRTIGDGPGFHVHYTHGSTYVGLRDLLRHVHDNMIEAASRSNDPEWRMEARTHLGEALAFGDVLAARYLGLDNLSDVDARQAIDATDDHHAVELSGYGALLYTNTAFIAHTSAVLVSEPKQFVAVLSRNDMLDVYQGLDPNLRVFLHTQEAQIKTDLHQRVWDSTPAIRDSGKGGPRDEFLALLGEATHLRDYTVGDYLNDGLGHGDDQNPIRQSDVVATTTLSALDRNNVPGIPLIVLEIRSYGDHFVDAATAWNNHLALESVTQNGFRRALRLTGGGNGPGGGHPGGGHPGGGPGQGGPRDGGGHGGHPGDPSQGGGRGGGYGGDRPGGHGGNGYGGAGYSGGGYGDGQHRDGGSYDSGNPDSGNPERMSQDSIPVLPPDDVISAALRERGAGRDLFERAVALYPPRAYHDMLLEELPYERRGLNRVAYTLDRYGEEAAHHIATIEYGRQIDLPRGPRLGPDLVNDVNTALRTLAGPKARHVTLDQVKPIYQELATHTHTGHSSRSAAERIAQILHMGRPDRMLGAGSAIEAESTEPMAKRVPLEQQATSSAVTSEKLREQYGDLDSDHGYDEAHDGDGKSNSSDDGLVSHRPETLVDLPSSRVIVETKRFYRDGDNELHRTKDSAEQATPYPAVDDDSLAIPEFVTGIMPAHQEEQHTANPEEVRLALLDFESRLGSVTGPRGSEPAQALTEIFEGAGIGVTALGEETLIGPRTIGDPPGMHVHFTHGSTHVGLRSFLRHVAENTWRPEAKLHLEQGLAFGDQLAIQYLRSEPGSTTGTIGPGPYTDEQARAIIDAAGDQGIELSGDLALLYSNTALVAHGQTFPDEPKKLAAALSRNDMVDVYNGLRPSQRAFLNRNPQYVRDAFAERFSDSTRRFPEIDQTRPILNQRGLSTAGRVFTVEQYLNEGLGRGDHENPILQDQVVSTTRLDALDVKNQLHIPLVVIEVRSYVQRLVNADTAWQQHLALERVTQEGFERAKTRYVGHSGGSRPDDNPDGGPHTHGGSGGQGSGGHGGAGRGPGDHGSDGPGSDGRGTGGGRYDPSRGPDRPGGGGHGSDPVPDSDPAHDTGTVHDGGPSDALIRDTLAQQDPALVRKLYDRAATFYPPPRYRNMLIDERPYQRRGLDRVAYALLHHGEPEARRVVQVELSRPIDLPGGGPKLDGVLVNVVNLRLRELDGSGARHVTLDEIRPVYEEFATHTSKGHNLETAALRIAQVLRGGEPTRGRAGADGWEVEMHNMRLHIPAEYQDGIYNEAQPRALIENDYLKIVADHANRSPLPEIVMKPIASLAGDAGRNRRDLAYREYYKVVGRLDEVGSQRRSLADLFPESEGYRHDDLTDEIEISRAEGPDRWLTHHSVGLELAGVREFLRHVRDNTYHDPAKDTLTAALAYADQKTSAATAQHLTTEERDILGGFLAIVHSHVSAATHVHGGQAKELVGAVSRTSLHGYRQGLPTRIRQYLDIHENTLRTEIEADLRAQHGLPAPLAKRLPDGSQHTIHDYLDSALRADGPAIDHNEALAVRTNFPALDSNLGAMDRRVLVLEVRSHGLMRQGGNRRSHQIDAMDVTGQALVHNNRARHLRGLGDGPALGPVPEPPAESGSATLPPHAITHPTHHQVNFGNGVKILTPTERAGLAQYATQIVQDMRSIARRGGTDLVVILEIGGNKASSGAAQDRGDAAWAYLQQQILGQNPPAGINLSHRFSPRTDHRTGAPGLNNAQLTGDGQRRQVRIWTEHR